MTLIDRMMSTMESISYYGSWFPAFLAFFGLLYVIGRTLFFRSWTPRQRLVASSCFISLFHGSPAAILGASAILTHPVRGFAFPNSDFQNLVLDYSVAYFTIDLLHLILIRGDPLFIAHHVATLFVFVTCRYVAAHGAFALLVLLVLAEVTSFCQNVWTLAGARKADSPVAANVYKLVSPLFYSMYTLMRVFAGPWFFYKMSAFYLSGKANDVIPKWIAISWIVVVGGAISVSILWISNHWAALFSEKKGNSDKKER
ncbi:TLC domain-containing protein-like [Iris pallida]|uniref:TLC domain-containing protein-like n=1 Tax=Iris pallida TaxID=29817 RepID=A0AAX6F580_IRIPA|nr:TLC domain-containing protein-like [Iris pallida]